MNLELNHLQIFERLVLGCMDSYDSRSSQITCVTLEKRQPVAEKQVKKKEALRKVHSFVNLTGGDTA